MRAASARLRTSCVTPPRTTRSRTATGTTTPKSVIQLTDRVLDGHRSRAARPGRRRPSERAGRPPGGSRRSRPRRAPASVEQLAARRGRLVGRQQQVRRHQQRAERGRRVERGRLEPVGAEGAARGQQSAHGGRDDEAGDAGASRRRGAAPGGAAAASGRRRCRCRPALRSACWVRPEGWQAPAAPPAGPLGPPCIALSSAMPPMVSRRGFGWPNRRGQAPSSSRNERSCSRSPATSASRRSTRAEMPSSETADGAAGAGSARAPAPRQPARTRLRLAEPVRVALAALAGRRGSATTSSRSTSASSVAVQLLAGVEAVDPLRCAGAARPGSAARAASAL